MSHETVGTVREIYDALGRGDVEAVLGLFGAEIEWHEAEGGVYGGTYRGPDEVAANVFAPLGQDIEGFRVSPDEFFADGEEVVMLGRYSGTGRQTGTRFSIPAAHAWTVRGGKAVRFRQFLDTAAFNEVVRG